MKKYFPGIFFIFFLVFTVPELCGQNGASEIFVPKWTPLYETEDVNKPPRKSVPQDMMLKICGRGEAVYRMNGVSLQKNMDLVQVEYPDGKKYFFMEGVYFVPDHVRRIINIRFEPWLFPMLAGILFLLASCLLFYLYCKKKEFPRREFIPCLMVIFLHWGTLLYLIGRTGNTVLIPIDEFGYFEAARDILNGEFSGPWRYTLGLSFLYMPFILLFKAASFPEINLAFSIFTGFVLRPAMLCFFIAIMKKLASPVKGMLALGLWYILLSFYHYRYFFIGNEGDFASYIMKSFFLIPDFSQANFHLFAIFSPLGYNALSDTPSACLILGIFALGLYMKNSYRDLIIFSLLFAFACLVRVNNIMFAPLFGFLLFLRYRERLLSPKDWIRHLLIGGAAFLTVFSIQLLVNKYQFGSFFSFPYVLHGYKDIAKGFTFYMVPFGVKFLGTTNHLYFVLAASSFFFLPGRKERILFALWVIPLLFFFTGYPVIHNHATRFIISILPGCLGIFLAGDFWKVPSGVRWKLALAVSVSSLLTAPAATAKMERLLPFNGFYGLLKLDHISRVTLAVLAFSLLLLFSLFTDWKKAADDEERKKILKSAAFLSLFLLLFHTGQPYLVFSVLAGILLWELLEIVLFVKQGGK